ncbi:hypothetical protein PISMIDRAFT_671018 [Pisolithus microcarpus 441]|uniref:DUF6534 domain-containing protein n=1 Tax=Pisolithus microcarpus 441 TaxID=765257 RepID=A0A0D0AFF5_9AGAM|nr:hypothetical protein PISMIDRAFT_671018 [Pisolithus microcarpus 441]
MAVIDSTFGAYLIGVVISAVLYGVTCVQVWYYYVSYPTDPWHIKSLVFAVFASDTVHQALVTHSAYIYLVSDITNPAGLQDLVWSLIVEVLFNAITAFLVQCFLSMRVYRLSNKSIPVTVIVMSSVIAEFVLSITYVAKALPIQTFAGLLELKGISSAVNATTAASDVLIAGCLCFLLQKSRTGFRRSDTMINKLMLFSLNTGLLTGIFAVASLISISVWPDAFIYIAFYFCVGRLYCNSLLATLNARRIIRAASTDDDLSMSLQGARKTNLATSQRPVPNNISIKIDTTHELVRDDVRDERYSASGDMKAMNVV